MLFLSEKSRNIAIFQEYLRSRNTTNVLPIVDYREIVVATFLYSFYHFLHALVRRKKVFGNIHKCSNINFIVQLGRENYITNII